MSEPKQLTPTESVEAMCADMEIEHSLQPYATRIRQLAAELESVLMELSVLKDERDDLRRQVEDLTTQLRIIGDKAVVDWDNETVGQVDSVIKTQPPTTYIAFVRKLYTRGEEIDQLRAENAVLQTESKLAASAMAKLTEEFNKLRAAKGIA